ncbi:hypothetical protein A6U97_08225 [Agrobacterium tumefaciens]|uniref:hypothetical protein n=1 Tax=Agrobacterium tumefaciens TaxID=358 RepID=UPI00080FA65A|nr:hypothetical protein A6U97_08225 [Agrobacterium tumefaciens]
MFAYIATVLSSGLVAGLVSFFLALKRDQHLSRQQKAEQLYRSADRWARDVGGYFIGMLPILAGGGRMNDGTELAKGPETGAAHSEVEMLIAFYFPEVSPAWQNLFQTRGAIVKALIRCDKGDANVSEYDAALALWQPARDRLLEAIAAEGRKYASFEPWKNITITRLRQNSKE